MDLTKFRRTKPYASQLYGIYQPLLGWKSAQQARRIDHGLRNMLLQQLNQMGSQPPVTPPVSPPTGPSVRSAPFESEVGRQSLQALNDTTVAAVRQALSKDAVDARLAAVTQALRASSDPQAAKQVDRETRAADLLVSLGQSMNERQLRLLTLPPPVQRPTTPGQLMAGTQWLMEQLDPSQQLARAVISPIGLVHLFRQYFFEFDSFLGPSVQHIWMSPGSTLELVEVSTRKVLQELTIEQASESLEKSEKSTALQDELSDAQKQENARDTKLGVSLSDTFHVGTTFIGNSATVNSSLNYDSSQKSSREQTHRSRRDQSAKTSSELKQSYKSVFRTVTENTDTQSKRYVLSNTTDKLLNYELRRKMRSVGVQLQDVGSYLCWQTYVDAPGAALGIADLVHVAQPADLSAVKDPDQPPAPAEYADPPLSINWTWKSNNDPWSQGVRPVTSPKLLTPRPGYVYSRSEVRIVSGEAWAFMTWPQGNTPSTDKLPVSSNSGASPPLEIRSTDIPAPNGTTERSVSEVNIAMIVGSGMRDDDDHAFTLEVTIYYKPSLKTLADTAAQYTAALAQATEAKKRLFTEALYKAAAERIKLASNLQPRSFEDLRNEERIVVYRNLVGMLLEVAGVQNPNPPVRHVFSELVQSIFDIDQMLYFVAPEWWQPKPLAMRSPIAPDLADVGGQMHATDPFALQDGLTREVGWGGPQSNRPDNYYVTEDSAPAKMGRSLGWLIQLDGDTSRNAFLNAPWVKAVVPIRDGKEMQALKWLGSDTIEGADGLHDLYAAKDDAERMALLATLRAFAWDDPALVLRYASLAPAALTIEDALRAIVARLRQKSAAGQTMTPNPNPAAGEAMGALPVDTVFEFGFAPLDGFKAEQTVPFDVFDQWIETVPTDQIVPVEVRYDPVTGAMIGAGSTGGDGTATRPNRRVFLQIAAEGQRAAARDIIAKISAKLANTTPADGIELTGANSPDATEVRYYFSDDLPVVTQIADIVRQRLGGTVPTKKLNDFPSSVRPGTIEVWIGKTQAI